MFTSMPMYYLLLFCRPVVKHLYIYTCVVVKQLLGTHDLFLRFPDTEYAAATSVLSKVLPRHRDCTLTLKMTTWSMIQ